MSHNLKQPGEWKQEKREGERMKGGAEKTTVSGKSRAQHNVSGTHVRMNCKLCGKH